MGNFMDSLQAFADERAKNRKSKHYSKRIMYFMNCIANGKVLNMKSYRKNGATNSGNEQKGNVATLLDFCSI